MRDIFELAPHVLPTAPTCPDPTMIHHLREAAIEFCERTRYWRSSPIIVVNGETDLLLVTPDSVVHDIESVRYRVDKDSEWSNCLMPVDFADATDTYINETESNPPQYFTQAIPNTLRLAPYCNTGELRVTMFLKPDQDADTLPDFLFETFPRVIAHGALAEILLLAGNEFTNPKLAMSYRSRFDAACDKHFQGNLRGQHRAPVRSKANFF